MSRMRRPLRERFLEKVRKTSTCWEWAGTKSCGYARIEEPTGVRPSRTLGAHRVAYELFVGPIPEGKHILHHCDNPGCVNPEHLFLGTQADNVKDSVAKGRQARGERNGSAKLTQQQVQEIRDQYQPRSHEFGSYALARRYDVDQSNIILIVHGETWR